MCSWTMKRSIFARLKYRNRSWYSNPKQLDAAFAENAISKVHYSCSLLTLNYFSQRSHRRWYATSVDENHEEYSSPNDIGQYIQEFESIRSVDDLSNKRSMLEDCKLDIFEDEHLLKFYQKVSQLYHQNEFKNIDFLQDLINRIDKECKRRASSWDTSTFMEFLKQYSPYCAKNSKFMFYAVNQRLAGVFRSPLPTILEYFQIMNDTNSWRKYRGSKYELEWVFKENFSKLNLQEIELVLESLVTLESYLVSDKLKKKLCSKLTSEFDMVTNSMLKKFFMLFCNQALYARNFLFITPWLLQIFKKFHKRINDFDLECLNYAALLCTRMFIYDSYCLEHIAKKLLESTSELKLKEIEAAVYALTYFDFHLNSTNIYFDLVKKMRENPLSGNLSENPKIFLKILYHFSNVGVYPYDLLDIIFSKNLLKNLLGPTPKKHNIPFEMHALLGGMSLECPDYKGNLLDKKLLRSRNENRIRELPEELKEHPFIENVNSDSMNPCLNASRKISSYNRVLYCTRGILDDMFGGTEYTHVCFLLSHFKKANVLFCLDNMKKPQEIPQPIRQTLIVNRKMLNRELNWYVVAFVSHNSYTDSPPLPMGHEVPKIRQFELQGYNVITIVRHGWLKTGIEEKKKIITKNIFADTANCLATVERFN